MNSVNKMIATGLLLGMGLAAQPMVASAAPDLTVQSERAAHPRIVEAIAAGRHPPDLTVIGLTRRVRLPLLWTAQEETLGIR